MTKQIIRTPDAPSSPLFSQGVKIGAALHISGMTAFDPATQQIAGTTIQEQTRQALRNCQAILEAARGTLDDVVNVLVLLARPGDFAGMNEVYATVFPADPPARAVSRLGVEIPNVLVSIVMTAHVE